jgi:predicted transcriptional regulator
MPRTSKKASATKPESAAKTPAAQELEAIKRLLILQLISSGVQSTTIATTLGVSNSAITRMVPARKVKKASKKAQ